MIVKVAGSTFKSHFSSGAYNPLRELNALRVSLHTTFEKEVTSNIATIYSATDSANC